MSSTFDPLIHQAVRLRVMATLCTLPPDDSIDFVYLKKLLHLTDGNLGSHLEKLEQAGYLQVQRLHAGRNAKSLLQATTSGRAAYENHRRALLDILESEGDSE
ncbi:MAG: transcriptional regulator [Verrucomicrobiota bacterium]